MRTISTATLDLLNNRYALESILVVEVQWVSGQSSFYADQDTDDASGRIVQIAGLDDVTRTDGAGKSSSCSITLIDPDNSLKGIIDTHDVHLVPVKIYQWFKGVSWSDKFLLVAGKLNTPLVWSEGDRTLSFDVVSVLESAEYGYDISEGNYPSVPQELLGKAWPMLFGHVLHWPAMPLRNVPTGFTLEPFGIVDPNLAAEIGKVTDHIAALKEAANICLLNAILACFNATSLDIDQLENSISNVMGDTHDCNGDPEVKRWNDLSVSYQEEANSEKQKLDDLTATYAAQVRWVRGTVKVQTNVAVQMPYSGMLRVGNNLFYGDITPQGGSIYCRPVRQPGQTQQELLKQGFQFYPTGTPVAIAGPYELPYAVSLVPGDVLSVWAYRSYNGIKGLCKVPTSWYTVGSMAVGQYDCVTVTLNEPLPTISQYIDMQTEHFENNFGQYMPPHLVSSVDWEDQLYVEFQSSVGPNTVDIISYFATTYLSGITVDSASATTVSAQVANFPMNFGLNSKGDVLQIIGDLAYQNCCAAYIKDGVLFFKYLPASVSAVDSISESDVEFGSLTVDVTPTESLITKYEGTYRVDYTPTYSQPATVVLRRNIKKYGLHQESHDFFAFNNYYLVERSMTYWMIRKSNTWKYVNCKLLPHKLTLETFDTVLLNFSHPFVASVPVKGIVESAIYNSAEHVIDVRIWTPVRLGEMLPAPYAWPADMSESDFVPYYQDPTAGSGQSIGGGQLPEINSQSTLLEISDIPNLLGDGTRSSWDQGSPTVGGVSGAYDTVLPLQYTAPNISMPSIDRRAIDYVFPKLQDPAVAAVKTGGESFPCQLGEFVGMEEGKQAYRGQVYTRGLDEKPTEFSKVKILQLHPEDRIPPQTWCLASISVFEKDNTITREATASLPIWLRSAKPAPAQE